MLYNLEHLLCVSHACRTVVIRLMSAAGTGYYYAVRRPKNHEKMMLMKYDPKGTAQINFRFGVFVLHFTLMKVSPTTKI